MRQPAASSASLAGGGSVIQQLAFSPDCKTLAVALSAGTAMKPIAVELWHIDTGKRFRSLREMPDGSGASAVAA